MSPLSFPLHRAFLALPLEDEAKKHFQELQKRLKDYEDLFRFQNPETTHLSLYFWPTVMEIEYGAIIKRAAWIAARTQPFTLEVTGAGTFEEEKLPSVLFLTIERSEDLAHMKKLCPWPNVRHAACPPKLNERRREPPRAASRGESKHGFHPHITLARMKNPNAFRVHQKKILKLLKDVSFEIPCNRLRLYAEIEGVKQTPIQDFPFSPD